MPGHFLARLAFPDDGVGDALQTWHGHTRCPLVDRRNGLLMFDLWRKRRPPTSDERPPRGWSDVSPRESWSVLQTLPATAGREPGIGTFRARFAARWWLATATPPRCPQRALVIDGEGSSLDMGFGVRGPGCRMINLVSLTHRTLHLYNDRMNDQRSTNASESQGQYPA